MSGEIDPQEFGGLKAEVHQLKEGMKELREDVKKLLAAVENAKGGWKTVMIFASASAAMGGLVVKFLPFLFAVPLK